jgi:hypothetical protein
VRREAPIPAPRRGVRRGSTPRHASANPAARRAEPPGGGSSDSPSGARAAAPLRLQPAGPGLYSRRDRDRHARQHLALPRKIVCLRACTLYPLPVGVGAAGGSVAKLELAGQVPGPAYPRVHPSALALPEIDSHHRIGFPLLWSGAISPTPNHSPQASDTERDNRVHPARTDAFDRSMVSESRVSAW